MDLDEKRRIKREYAARWRAANPEKHRAINKKSRDKNLAEIQERSRLRYHETKHLKPELTEEQRARKSEINREHRLRTEYGLTVQEYEKMSEYQGHVCAICGKPDPKFSNLAVDHCHESGQVRGLLCRLCNTGIGALGDNVEGLLKALEYLKRYE